MVFFVQSSETTEGKTFQSVSSGIQIHDLRLYRNVTWSATLTTESAHTPGFERRKVVEALEQLQIEELVNANIHG